MTGARPATDLTDRLDHLMMALDQEGRADDAALVHEALDELRDDRPKEPDHYAIVALLGHQQRVGRVSEETVAGAAMLRVDIPLEDGTFSTRHVGGAAIYEITYVTEEVARAVAKDRPAHPLGTWSAQRLGRLPQSERAVPADRRLAEPDDAEDEDDEEGVF